MTRHYALPSYPLHMLLAPNRNAGACQTPAPRPARRRALIADPARPARHETFPLRHAFDQTPSRAQSA